MGKMKVAEKRKSLMHELEAIEEYGNLGKGDRRRKMEVQEKLWWVIRCSDLLTKQKAKVRWLVEDDKNSKYFYSSLKWRRRNGTLKGLLMGGVWVAEPGRVKQEVQNFIENKFCEIEFGRPKLDEVQFKKLSSLENSGLSTQFLKEVKKAIWDYEDLKSPGPDGYNFRFIKAFWRLMRNDVMRFLGEFHANVVLPKGGNSSFISLIPKVQDPQGL